MSSDPAVMTGLSESKAKWTDSEKLALLVSVINDTNPNPNWATLTLPRGRTLRASQTIFGQLKKEAAAHPMAGGGAIPASKKRVNKSAKENEGQTTGTPKKRGGGGRKPKAAAPATTPPSSLDDDEEESPSKKVKMEVKVENEEDSDTVEGENVA